MTRLSAFSAIRATSARRTELGLLILGTLIVSAAYTLVSIGATARIPANLPAFLGIAAGLALIAHIANRFLAANASPVLLPIVMLLNGLGYVMIVDINDHKNYPPQFQAVWTSVGVGLYILALGVVRRSRDLDRYRYVLLLVAAALLLSPLIPHFGQAIPVRSGPSVRLFVHLGPLSGQPVELAKLALVIFFASYFSEKRELLSIPTVRVGDRLVIDPRPLAPVLVAWAFCMLILAVEHDIGFAVLLFALFMAQLWLVSGRLLYVLGGLSLFVGGVYFTSLTFSQVGERIANWLHPWGRVNVAGGSYQLVQGLYGMGTGGLLGTGLGFGHVNLSHIPEIGSDYIFAAFGTEWGLLGTVTIAVAFLLITGCGMRIALSARSEFATLAAAGFTVVIGTQAFFIMGGIVRLLPLTGITLPFIAYGGSSLVANYVLIALLMRISDEGSTPVVAPQATAMRVGHSTDQSL